MATKLLMRWDIQPDHESEYSDFVANEFIPRINKMGVVDIQAWYTAYGDVEQILVSGVTQSKEQMNFILASDEWERLRQRLDELVSNFSVKIVPASTSFQL